MGGVVKFVSELCKINSHTRLLENIVRFLILLIGLISVSTLPAQEVTELNIFSAGEKAIAGDVN